MGDCISAKGYDSPYECPGYDIKQSDGEATVMIELWGMQSTLSLPSLLGLLCPGVVALDRVLTMGQIELFDIKLGANKWVMLNWIDSNTTVWSFNCV